MKPPNLDEISSPAGDEKSRESIYSIDERDIIESTILQGEVKSKNFENGNGIQNDCTDVSSPPLFTSPTTDAVIKANNQVLCPLGRKMGKLLKYCGAYAKFAFVDNDSMDPYELENSPLNDDHERRDSVCTCCTQCKICRRYSDSKNFVDAITQTDVISTKDIAITADIIPNSDATSVIPDPRTGDSRVMCTYLAKVSETEFYPTKKQKEIQIGYSRIDGDRVDTPEIKASTPRRCINFQKPSSRRMCSSDLFLNYLKVLILRRKAQFGNEFWAKYEEAFTPAPSMNHDDLEYCRRRFGDGFSVDQLQRMFPTALKSSTPVWRREMMKCEKMPESTGHSRQKPATTKEPTNEKTPKSPADQYIRIDRIDQVRSATENGSKNRLAINFARSPIWTTPIATSSPISTLPKTNPSSSKLRPIKMNRAALLRAGAIYGKYWGGID